MVAGPSSARSARTSRPSSSASPRRSRRSEPSSASARSRAARAALACPESSSRSASRRWMRGSLGQIRESSSTWPMAAASFALGHEDPHQRDACVDAGRCSANHLAPDRRGGGQLAARPPVLREPLAPGLATTDRLRSLVLERDSVPPGGHLVEHPRGHAVPGTGGLEHDSLRRLREALRHEQPRPRQAGTRPGSVRLRHPGEEGLGVVEPPTGDGHVDQHEARRRVARVHPGGLAPVGLGPRTGGPLVLRGVSRNRLRAGRANHGCLRRQRHRLVEERHRGLPVVVDAVPRRDEPGQCRSTLGLEGVAERPRREDRRGGARPDHTRARAGGRLPLGVGRRSVLAGQRHRQGRARAAARELHEDAMGSRAEFHRHDLHGRGPAGPGESLGPGHPVEKEPGRGGGAEREQVTSAASQLEVGGEVPDVARGGLSVERGNSLRRRQGPGHERRPSRPLP